MAEFGTWLNATQAKPEFPLPKFPDWVHDIRDTINDVIDFLLSILDLALAALEIVKAFAIGFLDPINAIIDAIIAEVEEFLNDLRQAGLYITGDWYLAQPPFDDLRGGFAAFKTRMSARFTDTKDPTRPDLSERVPVFAMFLYTSVDFSAIWAMIRFLNQIISFLNFNLRTTKTLQTPVDLRAQYSSVDGFTGVFENLAETFVSAGQAVNLETSGGEPVVTLSAFSSAQVPDVAQLTWKLGNAVKSPPSLGLPAPPPGGFLIEVSTVREGLQVYYDRPLPNSAKVEGGAYKVQDREVGEVATPEGTPMVLYGGYDSFELDGIGYNDAMKAAGEVKDGAPRVFALKSKADTLPIPLEFLKFNDKYLLQRTFFVSTVDIFGAYVALFNPDYFQQATYRSSLRFDEMPYQADFEQTADGKIFPTPESITRPNTFYVRISTVSDHVEKADDFRYVLKDATADDPGKPLTASYGMVQSSGGDEIQISRGDRSEPSVVLELTFPSDSAKVYLQQLTAALAVLVLSRSDLEVGGEEEENLTVGGVLGSVTSIFRSGKAKTPTGLEPFAGLIPKILLSLNPNDYFDLADEDTESSDVLQFRRSLLEGCTRVAAELYSKMGAQPSIEGTFFDSAPELLTFTWADAINIDSTMEPYNQTILGSLSDYKTAPGLARNPECSGLKLRRGVLQRWVGERALAKGREPGFYVTSVGGYEVGSADRSPSLSLQSLSVLENGNFRRTTHAYYVRSILPPEVYSAAAQVLSFASGPALRPAADGEWFSLRFGQLLPGFDILLDMILNWVRSVQLGASSIVDAILAYIDYLESRILELQALLRRLDAIFEGMTLLQLPQFASLFLVGYGTNDILSQFLGAEDPPQDLPSSYGGGMVLLAASAPALVTDLFVEMFSE